MVDLDGVKKSGVVIVHHNSQKDLRSVLNHFSIFLFVFVFSLV
jgi:hypothetical protein